MNKPLLFKPIGSPKEISAMLKPFPKKTEIPVIMKQEATDVILHGPKNRIGYYFIIPDRDTPQKKGGLQPITGFKSIHSATESKEKKRLLEKLVVPKYNAIEKQALKEVRRKEGKLYLLNDM